MPEAVGACCAVRRIQETVVGAFHPVNVGEVRPD